MLAMHTDWPYTPFRGYTVAPRRQEETAAHILPHKSGHVTLTSRSACGEHHPTSAHDWSCPQDKTEPEECGQRLTSRSASRRRWGWRSRWRCRRLLLMLRDREHE